VGKVSAYRAGQQVPRSTEPIARAVGQPSVVPTAPGKLGHPTARAIGSIAVEARNPAAPPREQSPVGKHVPDEFVLLCETCGYEIEGLPAEGACPECGRQVGSSPHGLRPGTRWQRDPKWSSLFSTWRMTLRNPRRVFDVASLHTDEKRLLALSLGVAASMPPMAGYIVLVVVTIREAGWIGYIETLGTLVGGAAGVSVLVAAGWMLLWLLTLVEERGIRFWGPRRGWRITPTIAKVICAHASVGWVLGSVLAVVGHVVGWGLLEITNRHNVGIFRGPMQLAPITLPALGLIAGMLTFEVLVYIGMGRMKFANREKPLLDASMPPASMPSLTPDPLPSPHPGPAGGGDAG